MMRQDSGNLGMEQDNGSVDNAQSGAASDGNRQGSGSMVGDAKQKIQELASQARESAGEQVESRFASGKTRATESLGSIAQSLRSTSQQLRDQQQGRIGQYAEQAADKIEELSGYLKNATLSDVATRVEAFARREPAFFVGGALALGFFSARFIKSSQRGQQGAGTDVSNGQPRSRVAPVGAQRTQGSQELSGGWGNTGDRDVTATARRDWSSERGGGIQHEDVSDRIGST